MRKQLWQGAAAVMTALGIVGYFNWHVIEPWVIIALCSLCIAVGISGLALAVYLCAWAWEKWQRAKHTALENKLIRPNEHGEPYGVWHNGVPYVLPTRETIQLPAIKIGQETQELPVVQEIEIPTAPAFCDMPLLPQGKFSLGYATQGNVLGTIGDLLSTLTVGRPRRGKTTGMRFIIAQVLRSNGQILVFDPHSSLGVKEHAGSMAEYNEYAKFLEHELEQRKIQWRAGTREFQPLLVVADEYPVLAVQSMLTVAVLNTIVLEGRKYGMYALIGSQIANAELFGNSGMRDAMSSRYIYETSDRTARMAGLETEDVKKFMPYLEDKTGIAILATASKKPCLVAIPNIVESEMYGVSSANKPHGNAAETLFDTLGNAFTDMGNGGNALELPYFDPALTAETFPARAQVVESTLSSAETLSPETVRLARKLRNAGMSMRQTVSMLEISGRKYQLLVKALEES